MKTFEEFGLKENILKSVKEMGFISPMPVQEKVIPLLLKETPQDIIALAQTGTGKTAAFGLPIIQKTDTTLRKAQYLIISPTRELCLQIADDLQDFASNIKDIKIAAVFGGSSIENQIKKIKAGAQIISSTPGRLNDLINRKAVDLSSVRAVVLDEADEMLDMGFKDDLEAILSVTPKNRNTYLFSATMPLPLVSIASTYMKNPIEITIGTRNAGAENIEHLCFIVHAKDRYLALKRIADYFPSIYGIIFCRTRQETQEVADKLRNDGYNADALHGDLSQQQREVVMTKFRSRHISLLVATDVAARGIDVEDITHIINYNLPDELDVYTHRSGRTGRAGKKGTSIIIANLKEKGKLREIERKIKKNITVKDIPTGKDICTKQLFNLIDRVEKVEVDYEEVEPFLPQIYKKLSWMDRDELIKRFVSVEFNRFIDYYKSQPDLSSPREEKKSGNKRNRNAGGFTRFFINIGKMDELQPAILIGLINDNTGIRDIPIGEIDIRKTFSFFDADSSYENDILNAFKGKKFRKRQILLEVAEKEKNPHRKKNKYRKH